MDFCFVWYKYLLSLACSILQFHVDKKGKVSYDQTDMLIHVVNNQTNTILDVERCVSPSLSERVCDVHSIIPRTLTHVLVSCRVIQMIDENKEQLRNMFRIYNVVDVQPAVTEKLPDDISTLQVCEAGTFRRSTRTSPVTFNFASTLAAGHHHPGGAAVPGRSPVCHNELALSQSVRLFIHYVVVLAVTSTCFSSFDSSRFVLLQTREEAKSYCCRISR